MNHDPQVSVVMPTFNGAGFVEAALSSILNQTLRPAEILVVDDRSTDSTEHVVSAIARTAPVKIRFVRLSKNSGGPAKPMNVGVDSASRDVIAMLDQDDLMRPDRLQTQMQAIAKYPACSVAIGRFAIKGHADEDLTPMWPSEQFSDLDDRIDSSGPLFVPSPRSAFLALMKKNFAGSCSNFCFTRQSWKAIGGFDESIRRCVDLDFMFKAAQSAPIVVSDEVLFDYALRPGSLHHTDAERSNMEVDLVRWRAAKSRPEWAGPHLGEIRAAIRTGLRAAFNRRDWDGVAALTVACVEMAMRRVR